MRRALAGERQHPEPLRRNLSLERQEAFAIGGRERHLAITIELRLTVRKDHVGCAFRVRHHAIAPCMQRRHASALGAEWNLLDTGRAAVQRLLIQARLGGRDHERSLRGVAFDPPSSLLGYETSVGGENPGAQQLQHRRGRSWLARRR